MLTFVFFCSLSPVELHPGKHFSSVFSVFFLVKSSCSIISPQLLDTEENSANVLTVCSLSSIGTMVPMASYELHLKLIHSSCLKNEFEDLMLAPHLLNPGGPGHSFVSRDSALAHTATPNLIVAISRVYLVCFLTLWPKRLVSLVVRHKMDKVILRRVCLLQTARSSVIPAVTQLRSRPPFCRFRAISCLFTPRLHITTWDVNTHSSLSSFCLIVCLWVLLVTTETDVDETECACD